MSQVLKEMCWLLWVTQVWTSVYHLQTDGLVDHFNKTLKQMLRKAIVEDGWDLDQLPPKRTVCHLGGTPELHWVHPLQAPVREDAPGPPGPGKGDLGAAALLSSHPHWACDPNGGLAEEGVAPHVRAHGCCTSQPGSPVQLGSPMVWVPAEREGNGPGPHHWVQTKLWNALGLSIIRWDSLAADISPGRNSVSCSTGIKMCSQRRRSAPKWPPMI